MTARRELFGALAVAISALALTPGTAAATPSGELVLPAPVTNLPTFPHIGLRPDRRLVSHVPSTVQTREDVTVATDGGGTPSTVQLDEHLHVDGTGAYLIYEHGPARAAAPLDGSLAPVLELGTVVWQGFSPGGRDLAARLKLDPVVEAQRLPVRVQLTWQADGGSAPQPLGVDGAVPGPGTVRLTLTNTTGSPRALPTGTASPAPLASALTTLLTAARRDSAQPTTAFPLPAAGAELPKSIEAVDVGTTTGFVTAPMRVVGSFLSRDQPAQLSGPTVETLSNGGKFNGVLTGNVTFTLAMHAAGHVTLDVLAIPTLDERTLLPPSEQKTWSFLEGMSLNSGPVRQATDQLVRGAAAAARGAELSPYVGSDTKGPATTTFRYTISATAAQQRAPAPLHPRPVALGVVAFAGLAVVGGAAALWRRS
jgi:hypothetical protein